KRWASFEGSTSARFAFSRFLGFLLGRGALGQVARQRLDEASSERLGLGPGIGLVVGGVGRAVGAPDHVAFAEDGVDQPDARADEHLVGPFGLDDLGISAVLLGGGDVFLEDRLGLVDRSVRA